MNILENEILSILKELKGCYHVCGIKAEFETEGTLLEEALRLKDIVTKAGLQLTIKIGGCEAIKDMYDAKNIGIDSLVAPMIETPYAMKKYANAIKTVFTEEEIKTTNFLINIETITGVSNFKDILLSDEFNIINGVVLGRADLVSSLGISKEEVNSAEILNIAKVLSNDIKDTGKDFIVGGNVSTKSVEFFKELPYLTKFETRKVIFDAQDALTNPNKCIIKAIEFELMWMKNKIENYGFVNKWDEIRLEELNNRYCSMLSTQ